MTLFLLKSWNPILNIRIPVSYKYTACYRQSSYRRRQNLYSRQCTKNDIQTPPDGKPKVVVWFVPSDTTWANKAGENFRYYMVFETKPLDGAITIGELLQRLNAM